MKATILLLSLLSLGLAAPSAHKHTLSHKRRTEFLKLHAARVREALGYEPTFNLDPQPRHHRPMVKPKPYRESLPALKAQAHAHHHQHSASFKNDTICPVHHPFVRAHTEPSHGASLPNNTRNVDYSGNWCGIVQKAPPAGTSGDDTFISVQATWTMPTLDAPKSSPDTPPPSDATYYGSQWVGIDGYTYGGAILQAGTTSAVTISPNGTAINSASAWFEWFPDPESPISASDLAVSPGDEIFCSVSALNATAGTVVLTNKSSGQNYTTDFAAPSEQAALEGVNAEWIYEDFSAGGLVPFASFSPVVFGGCEAATKGGKTVGLQEGTVVDLVDGEDVLCNAAVGDGASMTVAYGPAA